MFELLAHADWSVRPAGRWVAVAEREGPVWRIDAPRPVGAPEDLIAGLAARADGGGVLFGADLPIGVPAAWAGLADVHGFLDALPAFGTGRWGDFFAPAATPDEIAAERPFYPAAPGGKRQVHLLEALGVADMNALRRRCEYNAKGTPSATPLFWTLGAAQVGRGALHFWETVLAPARAREAVHVWPFEGDLVDLARPGRVVVAETYPREAYGWFGLEISQRDRSKRRQSDRANDAGRIIAAAERMGGRVSKRAREEAAAGFPEGGDNGFDAMVGLLALLAVNRGDRPEGAPRDAVVREIEGWILGREAGLN